MFFFVQVNPIYTVATQVSPFFWHALHCANIHSGKKGRGFWEMLHFSSKHIVILLCMYMQSEKTEYNVVLSTFISTNVGLFKTTTVFLHYRKNTLGSPGLRILTEALLLCAAVSSSNSRIRPRFFDQVGHQTTNASSGNKYIFSK